MAVTFHKFSIRGYTSNMRSVDVFKCWPFAAAGEVSREDVESWLPPMAVPKFRWWSDELAVLRSNAGGEREDRPQETEEEVASRIGETTETAVSAVCPVCCGFNSETLTAVNAHIDGCLARTAREEQRQMRRSKSKAPKKKKRSIAEIFQVEDEEKEQQQPQSETVVKLWPFGGNEADEVSIKFRWLSPRLKALRSNGLGCEISNESEKLDEGNSTSSEEEEKLEMVRPVSRVFKAAAAVTVVNAMREERWQMRRLSSKIKPKAPKKRSIAEILTVAPQIDTGNGEVVMEVEEEDEDERNVEEEEENPGCGGAGIKRKKSIKNFKRKKKRMNNVMKKKKSKVGKRGVVPLNDESKKMKKKKNLFNNEFTAKKVDAYKRKVQKPVKSFRKPKGTFRNTTVALDDIDASSAHENKLGLKIISEEKLEKVKKCDSVGKQQKTVSSIRGILNNHKNVSGSNSSGCNIHDPTEESHSNVHVPASDRHVRFAGKDYILGPKMRNSFDEIMFNVSSDALASSLEKEQSSVSDEGTEYLEANRNGDSIAIDTDKRKGVSPIVESKQFSDAPGQVAIGNFLKQCASQEKSKHLIEKSESLSKVAFCDDNNLLQFDRSNSTTLHCSPYADISRPLSAFQAGQISTINTQMCKSGAFSSTGTFIDRLGDSTFHFASVNSNANTRTFHETSSSSASHNKRNERPKFPFHTYGNNDNNGQSLGGGPSFPMFSADTIDDSFLFPGWGKGSVRNNCMDQNYFGLPLNSHGELISFSSSGKVGMNQPQASYALGGSLSGLPANDIPHQSNQEYLSTSEKHVVHNTLEDRLNPFPNYPARLGVTELHGRERTDIFQHNSERCSNHNVQPLDSGLNRMRNPFIEQNQRGMTSNHKGNGMISPKERSDLTSPSSSQLTMRLMGKDVPIGRSSKDRQQFVSGDVWADEETRRRHYQLGRCSKQDWISGSQLQLSTENALQSGKIESSPSLQSTSLMKGADFEFLNLQNNHALRNGNLGLSRNASSNFHHIPLAPTSCAVYNRAPDSLPEQFISGAKPQGLSFQSQVLSTPCNFSQPTSLSNGELNDRKKHHRVTKSAFGFPFLHPVVEDQAKIPWFHGSYRSLPPCLFRSTDERLPVTSSSQSFPQNTWGNTFTTSSLNHSAEVLYGPNSVTHHCLKKTPLCPASIVQPPHVPVTRVTKPPSAINIGCRNLVKATDRVKLDDMITKDHHPCTNSGKRRAANLVDLTKPNKLPNIEVQGNVSRMIGLAPENSSAELQRNTRAAEPDPQVDSARGKCCQNEAQNLNPRRYLGFDYFNLDGVVISGPVELSPGAKHILKPSQNMDPG